MKKLFLSLALFATASSYGMHNRLQMTEERRQAEYEKKMITTCCECCCAIGCAATGYGLCDPRQSMTGMALGFFVGRKFGQLCGILTADCHRDIQKLDQERKRLEGKNL